MESMVHPTEDDCGENLSARCGWLAEGLISEILLRRAICDAMERTGSKSSQQHVFNGQVPVILLLVSFHDFKVPYWTRLNLNRNPKSAFPQNVTMICSRMTGVRRRGRRRNNMSWHEQSVSAGEIDVDLWHPLTDDPIDGNGKRLWNNLLCLWWFTIIYYLPIYIDFYRIPSNTILQLRLV